MIRFVLVCSGKNGEELHIPLGSTLKSIEDVEERVEKLKDLCKSIKLAVEIYDMYVIKEWMI